MFGPFHGFQGRRWIWFAAGCPRGSVIVVLSWEIGDWNIQKGWFYQKNTGEVKWTIEKVGWRYKNGDLMNEDGTASNRNGDLTVKTEWFLTNKNEYMNLSATTIEMVAYMKLMCSKLFALHPTGGLVTLEELWWKTTLIKGWSQLQFLCIARWCPRSYELVYNLINCRYITYKP
jgi:hypothetical protein